MPTLSQRLNWFFRLRDRLMGFVIKIIIFNGLVFVIHGVVFLIVMFWSRS